MKIVQTGDRVIRMIRGGWVLSALMLMVLLMSGCETVKPWQREALADPIMQPGRNPISAAQLEHVYLAREAASGGTTVGGGGCGCN